MSTLLGPDGRPYVAKRGIDSALTTGSLPDGAVSQSDLSGLTRALGDGLSVTSSLGPGLPMGPAHPEERHPRWYDYVPGANTTITPRQGETYAYETLYGLANTWDVAGIAIEKRKDEFLKLEPMIRPRPVLGQTKEQARRRQDALRDQIADAMGFLETPDQQNSYPSWLGRYLDDLFKGDCATMYLRANRGGSLAAAEVPDGTTIKPIIDLWGRIAQVPPGTPRHVHEWSGEYQVSMQSAGAGVGMACRVCGSAPGYAQVIKGMIWDWYGSDEVIYQPRWLRGKGPYGHPPAEGILLSINRALRRQSLDLAWYTEGTLPAAFLKIPESWSVVQGQEFMSAIDALYAGNDTYRSRMIPIPGGPNSGVERVMPEPKSDVEEYLLHIGCAAYAVSPMEMGFIRSSGGAGLGGKGVAEEQKDTGRMRQISLAAHIRRVYNRILATYWTPDLILFYPSLEERKDQLSEAQTLHQYWLMGAVSSDWIAENVLQLDPPGLGNTVVTAQGMVVPIAQINAAEPPPVAPVPPPTPSSEPGVNTQAPVTKALGGKHVEYTGDLAQVVHRYLLRSYPAGDIAWVLDPAISWEYDPGVKLDKINMARRPGGRNPEKVATLAEAIGRGASMDFTVLVEFETPNPNGLDIADGWHRTLGAEKAGKDAVPAMIGRDTPDRYADLIGGRMQAQSASKVPMVKVELDPGPDLRRWRQKAIAAVKRGEPAAVTFASDAIPAPHRELIAKALAGASSVEDVWDLFGAPAPVAKADVPRTDLGPKALAAAYAIQAETDQTHADQVAKIAADQADQHGREMAEVVTAVKAMADRPIVVNVAAPPPAVVNVAAPVIPAPIVKQAPAAAVDMTPVAAAFDALRDEIRRPRTVTKTIERDARDHMTRVTEEHT
jgi:hypothetical protein